MSQSPKAIETYDFLLFTNLAGEKDVAEKR